TKEGKRLAKDVYRRHVIFRDFLTGILNVDATTAEEDACKMEHAVSPVTLERFVKFMEFVKSCPRGGSDWLLHFDNYMRRGRDDAECLKKMKGFVGRYKSEIKKLEDEMG
ncbi:MAG: iron dependent repressor, metal binding and dimerization domain protein, partial [Thermodesulfobacteriota bacterium]|nr:iron dependent repressor, metal binding and dimerization domain protein [Thermodesulfobacteriota bacterium]